MLAFLTALVIYSPALNGAFLFDDDHLPFALPQAATLPVVAWLGVRPLTSLTFWLNYRLAGIEPFLYHFTNIFLHSIAAVLVFLIILKILTLQGGAQRRRTLVALFCSALFLAHPLQTEAVSYVSSRSEDLSVSLAFAAWAVFLYRGAKPLRGLYVAIILLLFGAAAASKEHVAVLPAVLLLTDYYWNPGFTFSGIRKNWRLYLWISIGGAGIGAFLFSYLRHATTAGFNTAGVTWYQYLFTQSRVLLMYLRLFVLPFNQCADYVIQLSRTPWEHAAFLAMLVWGVAIGAAFKWRKRFPVASYGLFAALIFFFPTSSFIPIKDFATERRVYLPMIGLLLILAEVLMRIKVNERKLAAGFGAVIAVACVLTWNRNHVWAGPVPFWTDVIEKAPDNGRAHFSLGVNYYGLSRCSEAVTQYQLARANHFESAEGVLANMALALDCAGRRAEAIQAQNEVLKLAPGPIAFVNQAMFLFQDGKIQAALDLLDRAERVNPAYVPLYIGRGAILFATNRGEAARAQFQKALSIDPENATAQRALANVEVEARRGK